MCDRDGFGTNCLRSSLPTARCLSVPFSDLTQCSPDVCFQGCINNRTGSTLFVALIIQSRTDLAGAISSYLLDFFFFLATLTGFFLVGDFDFLATFFGIIFLAVLLTLLTASFVAVFVALAV
jgi:hypothetical protein